MHRRPMPTSCGSRRTATDSCPGPTGPGETLPQLIEDYKRNYGDRQRAGREPYRDFANLTEAIRRLEPWECEDFLCIYKTRLARLKRSS